MSANTLPQTERPVKHPGTETTPEERAARVEAFKHLTQDNYDHLLRIVVQVVPRDLCDPTEALSEALLAATERYDGSTKLTTFVAKFARFRAMNQHRHEVRHCSFVDLINEGVPDDDAGDDYVDQIIGGATDPEYIEPIDERFTERIKEILVETTDSHNNYARPNVIPVALALLEMLHANANQGRGIGVDEWENAPTRVPNHPNDHLVSNTKQPLGVIRKKLATALNVPIYRVDYAIGGLRACTARALREGWLDYHSNLTA